MQYETQLKKNLKIFENENKNTIDINNLIKYDLFSTPENFKKNVVTRNLVVNYEMYSMQGKNSDGSNTTQSQTFDSSVTIVSKTSDSLNLSVYLPNFPEWAVPMTKIIPKFHIDDAWNTKVSNFNSQFSCTYYWKQTDLKNFTLLIYVVGLTQLLPSSHMSYKPHYYGGGVGPGSVTNIPLYLDLDLVFFNEIIRQSINSNKS